MKEFTKATQTKPNDLIGVGLRHNHYQQALNEDSDSLPVDFVEVHAENFFAQGGLSKALLLDVAQKYPISLHGTSLGLGSEVRLDQDVLKKFAGLVNEINPVLLSEHLCFNRALVDGVVMHSSDLLPIPYNQQSLNNICSQIALVQDAVKRPILIENLSAYIEPSQLSPKLQDQQISEFEFLSNMCRQSGCGLLLDLNNLIINELNLGNNDPVPTLIERLATLPVDLVGEIHLAGYSQPITNSHISSDTADTPIIIDDHGAQVSAQCWQLYEYAIKRFIKVPTLVEWDTNIPQWSILLDEADKARAIARESLESKTA